MYHDQPLKQLKSFIKDSNNEDLIAMLHVKNRFELEYRTRQNISDTDDELIGMDIDSLKSIQSLEEIRVLVLNYFQSAYDNEIDNYINDILELKKAMPISGSSISHAMQDKRYLYFLIDTLKNEVHYSSRIYSERNDTKDISNDYIRLLYLLLLKTFNNGCQINLERIKDQYSRLITEHPLHFEKYDDIEFYIWAKKYMDNDTEYQRRSRSTQYSPIKDEDYKPTIHAIFDALHTKDIYVYRSLKEKLLNAWYQKSYRKKNKGKKYYFFLTDKTYACLEILAKKENINLERVIERLINEMYSKKCKDNFGNDKYS
ncbi:hypothetical protein N5J44_06220 [Acinetobacter ursingii]|uniref:hypothetical protein n=1 Tax=Acinetobacter ursingii TaxID=108980 RepID=UPI002446F6C1|nr:hypothetical protein [Acinetobacter ursingii]MDH2018881.1 hypothetical protein [Acinetobacter ursingii]MDH2071146.1 hypothetical protein [Acinetobacter ursingii]